MPQTKLHLAALHGDLDGAVELFKEGVDVDARTDEGATAMHYAAFMGHRDIVDGLLWCFANPAPKHKNGDTPERWARMNGHVEIADIIKDRAERMEEK